jgi:hypothetical protein
MLSEATAPVKNAAPGVGVGRHEFRPGGRSGEGGGSGCETVSDAGESNARSGELAWVAGGGIFCKFRYAAAANLGGIARGTLPRPRLETHASI